MKKILKDIIISTIIIIIAAILVWNYYDISIFLNWVKIYNELGILNLYTMYKYNESYRVVYLPLAPITFIAFYSIGQQTANTLLNITAATISTSLSEQLKVTLIRAFSKIPLLAMVYATAYLIYKKEKNTEMVKWWFYNIPLILAVATYQFDPIMVFFLLLGAYLIVENKPALAGIAWGIGSAIKHVPAVLLPVVYMYFRNWREFKKFLLAFILVVTAISLPFLIADPVGFINNALGFHSDRPPQYLSIFNVPVLLTNRNIYVVELVTRIWPYIFALTYILLLLAINVIQKPYDKDSLFKSILAILILFTTFNKVVNPNYLLWAYPFAIYVAVKNNNLKSLKLIVVASIIAMSWPGLCFYAATVLDKPVYIEEEMKYYNARILVEKSFQGYGRILLDIALMIGYAIKPLIQFIYDNLNYIGVIFVVSYNSILLNVMFEDALGLRNSTDLIDLFKESLKTITKFIRKYRITKLNN